MRTAFLGTSEFAAAVLRRLAGSPHPPALVVTPPDRRQGRGRKLQPPPAAVVAAELGLDLLQSENVNEPGALGQIRAAEPAAVLVCAFGQLIREPLLSEFPILNVHPSLLPRWRGAAPIERAMMAGDATTGVCVMQLTAGLDSGPVAICEEVPIEPGEDFSALSARLAELGGELLVRALDLQAEGALELTEQSEDGVTYAEKIAPAERRLDPGLPAAELAAKVRALNPHVGTYLETAAGERLGVRRACPIETDGTDVPPGALAARDGALLLGCGEGVLRLDVVQPPGSKAMPADAYLRGHEPPRL
ncbi:MAG TPA: methionyl-tRNA formyltransferase [Solirubrobacterales bacterium]|nr:methionyl-tRNA formyltransferase [Solirubrobacterales bacterium]